jgi:signal transduction histidine kinase
LQRELIKEKKKLLNALEELKETQQMLIHSEKMNALGKLVAGVAHELNNPVSFVYSNLFSIEKYVYEVFESQRQINELIQQKASNDLITAVAEIQRKNDLQDLLADIADMTKESKIGIERVKTIVEDLRKFSRLDEAEIKQIDLIDNLKSTINIARSEIVRKQIEFQLVSPEKLLLDCYPGQLNQAIMNVLINAIDAVDVNGQVSLIVAQENNTVTITINDNGSGIADDVKDRIFDPFFTTKPVGSGVGLGLSITYKIIHDLHHGSIDVNSIAGQITSMKITIPLKIR